MDIGTIGVGAIIGSVIVVGTNLFIAQKNRKRDEIKERLEKLYLPMKRVVQKPNAMDNGYETFLELEKLYAEYEHLAAPKLGDTIDDIIQSYHSLLQENLTESEIKEKIMTGSFRSYKDTPRDFSQIMYDIYGILDANVQVMLSQYRGGFKQFILNVIHSFQRSPHSPKAYVKSYMGYRDDS